MPVLDQFFHHLEYEKRLSVQTITSYRSDLKQFADFLVKDGGRPFLLEATPLMIRSWIVVLMDQGIGARTVHRKISTLRHFYRFCLRSGLLTTNPADQLVLPKMSKRLPVFVEEPAMSTLLDGDFFEAGFSGFRDRLVLETLYGTGVRLSELIGMKDEHLDPERLLVRVKGKGNKERMLPLPEHLRSMIAEYQKLRAESFEMDRDSFLFLTNSGKKMYPKFVYRLVKRYLSYVTTVNKKSPHVMRHSYATHLLNRGADLNAIKELLGHSNLTATQVYTHTSLEKLKQIHHTAHPRAQDA